MANPLKGEVGFTACGRDRTLRLSTDAMCSLEAEFDLPMRGIMEQLETGRVTVSRAVFRACLDGAPSIEEVSEIFDEIGYGASMGLLSRAIVLSRPEERREAAEGARPPRETTAGSIGAVSSLIGSPPAELKTRSGNRHSLRS